MITLENINDFFDGYPIKNIQCKHNILNDYEKIFEVFDGSFGHLSYLQFRSDNNSEIFLGSYPLNGADLWKCKKCGSLKFFYTETGGHFPQILPIDVDFDKKYLTDPFAKAVSIKKEKINGFIDTFDFYELKNPSDIQGFNGLKIIDKTRKYIFAYNEFQDIVTFNIVADRDILRKIFEFEKS